MTHSTCLVDQGPDDFIARRGRDAFELLVSQALPFEAVARVEKLVAELADASDILEDLPTMLFLRGEGEAVRTKVERVLATKKVRSNALKNAVKSAGVTLNLPPPGGHPG